MALSMKHLSGEDGISSGKHYRKAERAATAVDNSREDDNVRTEQSSYNKENTATLRNLVRFSERMIVLPIQAQSKIKERKRIFRQRKQFFRSIHVGNNVSDGQNVKVFNNQQTVNANVGLKHTMSAGARLETKYLNNESPLATCITKSDRANTELNFSQQQPPYRQQHRESLYETTTTLKSAPSFSSAVKHTLSATEKYDPKTTISGNTYPLSTEKNNSEQRQPALEEQSVGQTTLPSTLKMQLKARVRRNSEQVSDESSDSDDNLDVYQTLSDEDKRTETTKKILSISDSDEFETDLEMDETFVKGNQK